MLIFLLHVPFCNFYFCVCLYFWLHVLPNAAAVTQFPAGVGIRLSEFIYCKHLCESVCKCVHLTGMMVNIWGKKFLFGRSITIVQYQTVFVLIYLSRCKHITRQQTQRLCKVRKKKGEIEKWQRSREKDGVQGCVKSYKKCHCCYANPY